MSSASQQAALTTPQQLNSGSPAEAYRDDDIRVPSRAAPKLRLGFLKLDDLSHLLRLRSRLRLTDQLSAEVGADLDVSGQAVYPKSALEYKVVRNSKHLATLRADRRALYVQKSFPVNVFDKVTCRLQATAATSYQGVPELSFGLEQVRPKWLIAVGAVALLAAGQPISQSKTFAGTSLHTPALKQSANLKGEAKALVQRNGKGIYLALQQLNAIIRI